MSALPHDSTVQLYRFYDVEDHLLYLGVAVNPKHRRSEHHGAEWYVFVDRFEVDPVPLLPGDGYEAERIAIIAEHPIFNVTHNEGYRERRIAYLTGSDPQTGAAPETWESGPFIKVPVDWVREVGLEAATLMGLIAFRASISGKPWAATRRDFIDSTGMSYHKIRTALKVLREAGWVACERVSSWDATLTWDPIWDVRLDTEVQVTPRRRDSTPRDVAAVHHEEQDHGVSPFTEEQTLEKDNTVAEPALFGATEVPGPRAVDHTDSEFAEFWSRYPRKVGRAKALEAFRRARKGTSLECIAAGLVSQLPDLTSRETAYVPHAATWLNQQRWADDPAHAVQATSAPRARVTNAFASPELGGTPGAAAALLGLTGPRALGARP